MSTSAEAASPQAKGPTWTAARLRRVMALRFGSSNTGGPNTAAVAAEMGVSRRTVQRWLHARHGRSLAHIPPPRLAQLIRLLLPDEGTLARERQQERYALKAIAGLGLPRKMGILPSWEKQRWLEAHQVSIIEVRVGQSRIRQFVVARHNSPRSAEAARRGKVVDQVQVPTRFHATVLVHQVLDEVHGWRFQAGTDQVSQGFTQAWLTDAPTISLADRARALDPKE